MKPRSQDIPPQSRVLSCPGVRYGLLAFGWISLGLGLAGAVLPLVPSTVFLLMALWAFSKSSARFHGWLYAHPRLGARLRDWHQHRVIPWPAKVLAVATMAASLAYVAVFVAEGWELPLGLGLLLSAIALYIVTRPHRTAA